MINKDTDITWESPRIQRPPLRDGDKGQTIYYWCRAGWELGEGGLGEDQESGVWFSIVEFGLPIRPSSGDVK